jgi:hypothetical protein
MSLLMENYKLILTHLWIYRDSLMARDRSLGLLILCSKENFLAGPDDSLKRHWTLNPLGIEYRKIRGQKQCTTPVPTQLIWRASIQHQQLLETAFQLTYGN